MADAGLRRQIVVEAARPTLAGSVAVLWVRISDNMFGVEDWPVWRLELDDAGIIAQVEQTHASTLHDAPAAIGGKPLLVIGDALDELLLWAEHDPTGQYPEINHEVCYDDAFEREVPTPASQALIGRIERGEV